MKLPELKVVAVSGEGRLVTLSDANEAIQAAYELGKKEAAPEWLPIETAPKSLKSILLSSGEKVADGYWGAECNKGKGAWVWPYVRSEPTNWMPLPAAPAPNKEEGK